MVCRAFILTFCLEKTVIENNWMRTTSVAVMVVFFKSAIPKVLDRSYVKVFFQELRGTLTTVFERQVTIKDFTDMD